MNDPQLKEVKEFKGGSPPGMKEALNKIVIPLNALIRKSRPLGGKNAGGPVTVLATIFTADGEAQLWRVAVSEAAAVSQITSADDLA